MRVLSKQILIFFLITINSFLFSQNCTELNPNDYGDCATPLGYIWYDNNCIYISGCNMNNDDEFFFSSYEECSLTCFNNSSLGDINDDATINVIDVITIVNLILASGEITDEQLCIHDVNSDGTINVFDVVMLVDMVLNQ